MIGIRLVRVGVQPTEDVDLLVGVPALGGEHIQGLYGSGRERLVAVELEGPLQVLHHPALEQLLLGEPLGKSTEGLNARHRSSGAPGNRNHSRVVC